MVVVMPVMPVVHHMVVPVVRMGGGRRRHRQRANGRQGHKKRLHAYFLKFTAPPNRKRIAHLNPSQMK
jgi:hypothetical protein